MKQFIYILFIFVSTTITAQVTKIINVTTSGTLTSLLTDTEKSTITNLTVTGDINACDFKCMRDEMLFLLHVDLKKCNIKEYNGNLGPIEQISTYDSNTIPYGAFDYKRMIQTIVLPTSAKHIQSDLNGLSPFGYCENLTSIILPDSLKTMGTFTFEACSKLESVIIPNGVAMIDEYVFFDNRGMKEIIIPESVKTINKYSFVGCNAKIYVDEKNVNFSSVDGVLFNKNRTTLLKCNTWITGAYSIPPTVEVIASNAFEACFNLTSVKMPSSVKTILNNAFFRCGITSVNFPNSIEKIEYSAFMTCPKLNAIYVESTTPLNLIDSIFNGFITADNPTFRGRVDKSKCMLIVPYGSKSAYQNAFEWKDFSHIVELGKTGNEMKTIMNGGNLKTLLNFTEDSEVEKLKISGEMDARDFRTIRDSFPELKELDISEVTVKQFTNTDTEYGPDGTVGVTSYLANTIPGYSFFNFFHKKSKNLTTIKLPQNLKSIGLNAFYFCSNLSDVILPDSLISIEKGAFQLCTGLSNINFPNNLQRIDYAAFGASGLSGRIKLPDKLKVIGVGAFAECIDITGFDLNNNPNFSIQDEVLYNKNFTSLYYCPFNKTGNIDIPQSVKIIKGYAFDYCINITGDLILPNSIDSIGEAAFLYCEGINSITIPANVKYIGNYAFDIGNNVKAIHSYQKIPLDLTNSLDVFSSIDKSNCILYVPVGSKSLYMSAPQWKDFANIVETATGIIQPTIGQFKVFPNPATNYLHFLGVEEDIEIEIYNLSGKIIKTNKLNPESNTMDIRILQKGVYLIKGFTEEGVKAARFVKE